MPLTNWKRVVISKLKLPRSVIASIRDGVFPSPRSAHASPRDVRADDAVKDAAALAAKVPFATINEESPMKYASDTSMSSDSVSYYLKLRKQDAPESNEQQQQQQQQHILSESLGAHPKRHLLLHQDSFNLTKERLHVEDRPPPSPRQQLQLRQVARVDLTLHLGPCCSENSSLNLQLTMTLGLPCMYLRRIDASLQDNEDEEEEPSSRAHLVLKHVDSQVIRHRFNATSEKPRQQDVSDSRSDSGDGLMFESQGSLDSQSKRAFAISFAGS
jgi:hypothetical protein